MSKYLAGDFARARFATHPDGRVACKTRVDEPWTHPSWSSDRVFSLTDGMLAARGWAPVQEQAGSYTRTDEVARTINAEEERDVALARIEELEDENDRIDSALDEERDRARRLRAEQPRPLTADDITDEMVERLRDSLSGDGWEVEDSMDRDGDPALRRGLVAALTVPQRPEGAEEIEAIIADQISGDVGPATIRDLADRIATEVQP